MHSPSSSVVTPEERSCSFPSASAVIGHGGSDVAPRRQRGARRCRLDRMVSASAHAPPSGTRALNCGVWAAISVQALRNEHNGPVRIWEGYEKMGEWPL